MKKNIFLILLILAFASVVNGANEIRLMFVSGKTTYAIVRNSAGQAWDPSDQAFEDWPDRTDDGDSAKAYDISMTDKSADMYNGDFDTNISAGRYYIQLWLQNGTDPNEVDDDYIDSREIVWNGTAEETIIDSSGRTDVGKISGTSQTANDNGADINAILMDTAAVDTTNEMRTFLTGGDTAVSTVTTAQVNTEVDNAIETYKLDHLVAVADSDDVVDDSIIAKLASKGATADWSDYDNTTDSQEAQRDKQTDIETDTQDLQTQIGTAGAGLTDLGGMSTGMKAEVNAEADTAVTDYDAVVPADLPTNFADLSITVTTGRVDVATIEGTDATDAINTEVDTGISDASLPTAAQAADAVWDEAKSGHTDSGSMGEEIQSHSLSSEISALNDPSDAEIWSYATRVLTDSTNIEAGIADQVWDEAAADHTSADSFGDRVNDTKTDTGNILTDTASMPADTADAVWDESTSGHTTGGTFGEQAKTDIDAVVAKLPSKSYLMGSADADGGLDAEAKADINTEVDTGISDASLPTAAQTADQVWDEAKADHVAAGSFGEESQSHATSAEISALNDPTAAAIADQVWDEPKSGHTGSGSFGEEVQSHSTSTEVGALNDLSAADAADAVWDEVTTGHTTGGTFGEQAKTDIDTLVTNVGTPVALDGGAATLGGMLTKFADDSGGSAFDATNDSLKGLRAWGDSNWGPSAATYLLSTDVAVGDTTTSFTMTAGVAANDAYNNGIMAVQDGDDSHWEARRISDYTSGRVVTVDTAFTFTPAVSDTVRIIYGLAMSGSGTTPAAVWAYGTRVLSDSTNIEAGIADAIWDEATSGHTTGGTFGEQVKTDIDTVITNIGTPVALDGGSATLGGMLTKLADDAGGSNYDATYDSQRMIGTKATDILNDTETTLYDLIVAINTATATNIPASITALPGNVWTNGTRTLTASTNIEAGIADQVWDEATSGHVGAGSFGAQAKTSLDAIKAVTDLFSFTGNDVKATLDSETVVLSAGGLDNIPVSDPGGVADEWDEMLVQVWRRFFKKVDRNATQIRTYDDSGNTVRTTQTVTDDGTTTIVGAAQ